jgi:ribosomal protein S7
VHFLEDPIFQSYIFNKFIGKFTKCGKKERAQKMLYFLFARSKNKKFIDIELFFQLVERCSPTYIGVPIRIRDKFLLAPMPVGLTKSQRIGIDYIYKAIKDRIYDHTVIEKIFNEFRETYKLHGYVNKYVAQNNKIVEENIYLRHYRRFPIY